jgi:hypothetical protein
VKPGQKVSITDDGGQQLHGRIGEMTADALTVLDDGKSAAVGYERIVTIDRPNDSLANGALIGLGAGARWGCSPSRHMKTRSARREGSPAARPRAVTRPERCCSAAWAPQSASASTRSSTASARSTAAAAARSHPPALSSGTAAAAPGCR